MEECSVLACSLSHLLRNLSYTIQTHLHRDGTAHGGLGAPTSTIDQDNSPEANLMAAGLQVRFPFPGDSK